MNQGQKIDIIFTNVSEIKNDVNDMKSLLYNNPKTGRKGIDNRLRDVEEDVLEIKTTDRIRMGKAAVVGGSATIAFYYIGKVLLKLIF